MVNRRSDVSAAPAGSSNGASSSASLIHTRSWGGDVISAPTCFAQSGGGNELPSALSPGALKERASRYRADQKISRRTDAAMRRQDQRGQAAARLAPAAGRRRRRGGAGAYIMSVIAARRPRATHKAATLRLLCAVVIEAGTPALRAGTRRLSLLLIQKVRGKNSQSNRKWGRLQAYSAETGSASKWRY